MTDTFDKKSALAFIVAFGVVSLFADMAYEGMRGIAGPFLASLGATITCVLQQEGLDHYAVGMKDPEGNEFDIN